MIKKTSCCFFVFALVLSWINLQAQTTLQKLDSTWVLLVDGQPFDVKGATFGYDQDVENYPSYFEDLQFLGVNTIRTWGTGENTPQLLDAAQAQGIKVMLGIWMRHGRPGMEADDSFNYLEDKQGMKVMYNDALETVKKYKDHPAILTWGIGNEVYLNMATNEEKEAYSIFLESICQEIKKIDPNHPITSVEAWTFGMDWWSTFVPSIDIYGLNAYGFGAALLQDEMFKKNIDKPYIITEFGVTGEWDIQAKKNGIEIEPSDQEKYDAIALGYPNWILNKSNCLGLYVFHYNNGNNFISPWLFTHHQGSTRPQYWAIRKAYTGEDPLNEVPQINRFDLPENEFNSGIWIPVSLELSDQEGDSLSVSFYYNQRTGGRARKDQINPLEYRGNIKESFEIRLPKENGAIKVYVNVKDSYNNMGIASNSILVIDEEIKNQKYLAAKTKLPFYVYKDGENNPYSPSGYMGNYEAISVDLKHKEGVAVGESCIKISYAAYDGWYGVGFVDPPQDWGDRPGGYEIKGAEKFSFWARASNSAVSAKIGFGLIDKDKPYPDSAITSKEIKLNTNWKKYTIKVKELDLDCVRSGLVVFSSSYGMPQDIYIDNVVFE